MPSFTLLSLCAAIAAANDANLITLSDYVAPFGARALDGSPYEFWHAPATSPSSSSSWVIDIMGGAWCTSLAACADRAYNPSGCYLGSSNASCFNADGERCRNKTAAMPFSCLPACNGARWCGGLLSNASSTNPLSHDWHRVLLPYHDGQSFTGNVSGAVMATFRGSPVPLFFRGKLNFLAAIDYMVKHLGLGDATEVALTGNSAGGLATYYHADALAALLPRARVWAAPDSGYFYALDAGYPEWRASLLAMAAMANSVGGLDASCVAAQVAARLNPAECAFPEVFSAHISTPLFVMQSRYDPALDSISAGEGGANATHVNAIGRQLLDDVAGRLLSRQPRNAAFLTACHQHCGQWSQGTDGDFNVSIAGLQAIPALLQWRAGAAGPNGSGRLWVQAPGDTYPCAECCAGGPPPPAVAELALLTEAAASSGAVFLDGSPAARYISRGDPSRWLIYQQGGGWCSSWQECEARANTSLGSSKGYNATSTAVMLEQGYLSNDPRTNPLFAGFTKVYIPYGDGASQLGDVAAPITVTPGAPPIFFRGARVLRAMIEFLKAEGLGGATEVVISGCSAGGLSTYAHADTWAAALPGARVVAMPDSGFFLNYEAGSVPANETFPARMRWTFDNANVSGGGLLPPACTAAHPGAEWLCMFAENLAPTLRTPTFALQSVHDTYQVAAILHAAANDTGAINAFGALLRGKLHQALLDGGGAHGGAVDACSHHCGGTAWGGIGFAGGGGGGVTQGGAFEAWYSGKGRVFEQNEAYPCAACCNSAQ